jgi:serine/threonine-protein kinase
MEDTLSGQTIGKYKISKRLGRGGMAEVYQAYQENLDRHVAIKVMHTFLISEEDFLERFKREARAMASLNHPNIVRIFDFDVYGDNSYYLVMEYINGGTLKERLEEQARSGERMPLEDAVKMITEIADALAYAHRRGMVHRDIKPANIMLDQDRNKAILTDFGIVKLLGDQSMAFTATGAMIGTPAYMSPEQALGQSGDERVDIYSLGVMLFQMVTNQLPFAADTPLAVVMKHVNTPTPMPASFNPDIPADIQDIILKAMAKNPDERYPTAAAMTAALRAANLGGSRATAVAATTISPAIPDTTAAGATALVGATAVQQTAVAEATSVVNATTVSPPIAPPTATRSKKPIWAILGGILLLLLIGGGITIALGGFGGDNENGATAVPITANESTNTPTATATQESKPTVTMPPDLSATQVAELIIALTEEAKPTATTEATATPTPSKTPTATPTPIPTEDATAQFLLECAPTVTLVSATRGNTTSTGVFTDSAFTIRWVLENSSNCPWPADLLWAYVDGETFGYEEEPIAIDRAVGAGETIEITADFISPEEVGTYESIWQLTDTDGNPVGEPVEFAFTVLPRETPTPTVTVTPAITATPEEEEEVTGSVEWTFSVESCEIPGDGPDWRCRVIIYPYIDGSDTPGNYTVFVFDGPTGQPAEYRGAGPFTHFAQARRCAAYNHEVRVVDDVTGTEISKPLYIDPNNYFSCTP